jgi:endoglucanase
MKKIVGIVSSLGLLLVFLVNPVQADFTDLDEHWAASYVGTLEDQGVVSGYEDGSYGPEDVLTRGQMAKIISLAFDLDTNGSSLADYADSVMEEGIAEGYRDEEGSLTGDFGLNDPLTRAEAVKMLTLAADLDATGTLSFPDVSAEEWYYDHVRAAYAYGLVDGYDNGSFGPDDTVTRGQIAKMVVLAEEVFYEDPVVVSEDEDEEEASLSTAIPQSSATESSSEAESSLVVSSSTSSTSSSNPFTSATFYVDPKSNAVEQIAEWVTSRPSDAADLEVIADQPTAKWFGDWSGDIESAVSRYVSTVHAAGNLPVLVAYNIPGRDCGSYSAGGSSGSDAYKTWIQDFADGVGSSDAVVILEPDALSLDCVYENSADLLAESVSILKSNAHVFVYIDAGHFNWVDEADIATRLKAANITEADGFALNVSNFYTTAENTSYGEAVSALVGGKHFVIDTSRNGNGSNGEWCNPSGMALGENSTVNTGNSLIDALLWVKPPGESDGTCNGGPSAGSWWADYALGLVRN